MVALLPSLYLSCLLTAVSSAGGLWPQPDLLQISTEDSYWLQPQLAIQLYCGGEATPYVNITGTELCPSNLQMTDTLWHLLQKMTPLMPVSPVDDAALTEQYIVRSAVARTLSTIRNTKFIPWKFYSRHSNFEPKMPAQNYISSINVVQRDCPRTSSLHPRTFFGGDESYNLSANGTHITINSNSSIGTVWALQTLQQMFYAHSSGSGVYMPYSLVSITDSPVWAHRGLSLDIARNAFLPIDVMRVVDGVASVKLNRLHLHVTDSQSWPIDVPSMPELAQKGAYQPSLVWTAEDLATVQQYGVERGVSVYLEIDMPGHTASIAQAFPDLIAAFDERDWSTFAAEPLSGQLKLNSSAVYKFLDSLFADLLPRTSLYSYLHHAGGDELNQMVYLLDETVRSNASDVIKLLLQRFQSHVSDKLSGQALQPVFWEEMVLDWNLTLPSVNDSAPGHDALIQVWRDQAHIQQVLDKGYRVLFGDYSHWYLDCGQGNFINPWADGKSPKGVPFNTSGGMPTLVKAPFTDYCDPYKNWREVYTYNPLENITAHKQHLIAGGEVLLWSEQTDGADLDQKLWPRAAAAAEVLWSGPRKSSMIEDASHRLGQWRERAVLDHNIHSGTVQMTWCLMEGGCDS